MDLKKIQAELKKIGVDGWLFCDFHNRDILAYRILGDPASADERITRTKGMFDLCVDLKTPILTTHIGLVPHDTESNAYAALVDTVREVTG